VTGPSVVIVDDEAPARRKLRTALAALGTIQLVGEARSVREAVALLDRERPDIVFLDVEMPDGDGFAVLESVEAVPPAVVFATGYDRHAVRAFSVSAVDYLLKPWDEARLLRALDRARQAVETAATGAWGEQLESLLNAVRSPESPFLERVAIRSGGRVRMVRLADIDYVQSSGNYLHLYAGSSYHVLRETMTRFEQMLDPARFVRIHRSVMVNVDRIREIEPHFHGDHIVWLADGQRLTLSRNYRSALKGRFGPEF